MEYDLYAVPCRTGLFENVDVKVIPSSKNNKCVVRFIFREKVWPELQSFKVAPSGAASSFYMPSDIIPT